MIIDLNEYRGDKGMTSINNVADYFLSKESMSHKKLQKICYYAYSWYLTLYDKHLFTDGGFEAWVHGPVNKRLYDRFKCYGWQSIPKINFEDDGVENEVKEFLDIIYDNFHMHTADELEAMTHAEIPWIEARNGLAKNEVGVNSIKDSVIKSFYSSLLEGAQVE